MKKLMSLLLLTFLSLPYLAWGMEVGAKLVGLSVHKIGPSQSNSKLPAESYKDLGYKDPDKDIKFEFWYMDNKKRPFYVKFRHDQEWMRLESGDRLFSPKPIDTLCYSLYKYKTDAASEYQCFDFKDRNKVFVQLVDGKFSGQVGTAPGGEKTAKALAFIGSKTPFRGKIRTTLSGLSLANNIKNDVIEKVAFTVGFPPNFTSYSTFDSTSDSTEESDLEKSDFEEFPPDFTEDNIKTLVDPYVNRDLEGNDEDNIKTLVDPYVNRDLEGNDEDNIKTLVDPYVNRDLEGNDIVTLELLDDASQHKITRQEANNSKTLKNILADIGAESIIPVIGINPTVIDSVIAVLVDPSKTRMLLDAYWKNGKFDEFIQFIDAINYLNIKNTIYKMSDTQKAIVHHITKGIRDGIRNRILHPSVLGDEGYDFMIDRRFQGLAPFIDVNLRDVSFDEGSIKTTVQVLRDIWGEDSKVFDGIIRFLVYSKEKLIRDHFNDFDENIQDVIRSFLGNKTIIPGAGNSYIF